MSKAKHTAGKWSVADYGHCIAVEVKLDNGQEHTIMTDQFCHAAKFNGDAMVNARLIAASPEMYEMLKSCLAFVDVLDLHGIVDNWSDRPKLVELIKKIEG